jgi:glycosyltransferase involved in cell wall biosynthesis
MTENNRYAGSHHAVPSFALVIPAYNRADLICETIDSALAQCKQFSEIIVVDDGSTDNTLAVLEKYKDKIVVIHTENKGVQAARNLGIRTAKSDYVTLCDSDDLLEPDFLEVFSSWLAAHPSCDVLYSNFVTFTDTSVYRDRLSDAPAGFYDNLEPDNGVLVAIPDLIEKIVEFQILFVIGMTLKRSAFDRIGEYNVLFNRVGAEDFEFTLRAATRSEVAFCTRPLARVRRHAGNDSSDQMRHMLGEIRILEYSLENHAGVARYRPAIDAIIDVRCQYVFDEAFARGDFELASSISKKFRKRPSGLRFKIKNGILNFPPFFRQRLWRWTQV